MFRPTKKIYPNKMHVTPSSLGQLAEQARGGLDFGYLLGDFLDAFYHCPLPESLVEEPALLSDQPSANGLYDAYLAAVAESLALRQGWPVPGWAFEASRYLHRPYFNVRAAAFRATLLLESPPAFRARNLFVTANALSRV
jgi:hypothetical protein